MTDNFADAAERLAPPGDAGGAGAWVLRHMCRRLACGALTIRTPDGARLAHHTGKPGPEASLTLHRWRGLRRLLVGGDVGFAEAYMDGDWSSPDLVALIELVARNDVPLGDAVEASWPVRLLNRLFHGVQSNTVAGARRNIVRHYDLGNAFYARWLDRGMTYSGALYRDPAMTLDAAQTAKQDRVLQLLGIEPGHEVLEIGFGWGGLAERILAVGGRLTGLTLSPAQHEYASARLAAAGFGSRADLRLQDYRHLDGCFDRIVSIEMLEAVGEAYWPVFFDALRARLRPGGVAVLQVITIAHERFDSYRRAPDFIQRHIFPGGMLPSTPILRAQIARAGLAVQAVETFGISYARTLKDWRDRFVAAWPDIAAMGFSQRFRRMWEYYLCYCEAGFRAGATDVGMWRLGHAG